MECDVVNAMSCLAIIWWCVCLRAQLLRRVLTRHALLIFPQGLNWTQAAKLPRYLFLQAAFTSGNGRNVRSKIIPSARAIFNPRPKISDQSLRFLNFHTVMA